MPTQSHAGEKQSTRQPAAKDRLAAVREPAAAAGSAGLVTAVTLGLTRDAWLTQQRAQLTDPRFHSYSDRPRLRAMRRQVATSRCRS